MHCDNIYLNTDLVKSTLTEKSTECLSVKDFKATESSCLIYLIT